VLFSAENVLLTGKIKLFSIEMLSYYSVDSAWGKTDLNLKNRSRTIRFNLRQINREGISGVRPALIHSCEKWI